jgi:hypothetical protein
MRRRRFSRRFKPKKRLNASARRFYFRRSGRC